MNQVIFPGQTIFTRFLRSTRGAPRGSPTFPVAQVAWAIKVLTRCFHDFWLMILLILTQINIFMLNLKSFIDSLKRYDKNSSKNLLYDHQNQIIVFTVNIYDIWCEKEQNLWNFYLELKT